MHFSSYRQAAFFAATLVGAQPCALAEILEHYSPLFEIHAKYKSMEGPQAIEALTLLQTQAPELLWITGMSAQVVDEDSRPLPAGFFCHANLDISSEQHQQAFGTARFPSPRLFTLQQGLTDIRLPKGFGIPVMSNEPLSVFTQAMNHNVAKLNVRVRIRVTVEFERASNAHPLIPLRVIPVHGLVLTSGQESHVAEHHHSSEPPDADPGTDVGSLAYLDDEGRSYSGHWIVPPGTQTNRTNVTRTMDLPADVLVHYVAPHVHPFAQYLELRDTTSDTTVLRANVRNLSEQIGIERVDTFDSTTGVTLKSSHRYELISEYRNPTLENQTAMSVLFMYARDDELLTRLQRNGGTAGDQPPTAR